MKLTSAQKEARLRQAADEMIAAWMAWDEANNAPTLTQMVLRTHFVSETRFWSCASGSERRCWP